MAIYATIEELEARYRVLTDTERTKAEALLIDASAHLACEFEKRGIDPSPETFKDTYKNVVVSVVCSMVKRALASSDSMDISSESTSVGGYSQSFTYANPSGDLYLKDAERRLLGIETRKQVITSIQPMTSNDRKE